MKLAHANSVPAIEASWRFRAHRRVKRAKRKGMARYITPLVVVPITPVMSRLPERVQLL